MTIPEITAGIRKGDETAFNAFHDANAERMFRYLVVIMRGDEFAARDILQESLLRVIRYIKILPNDEELWRYLSTVMRSAWIDRRRSSVTEQRQTQVARLQATQALSKTESEITDNLHGMLEQALKALNADDRQLIEEHYFMEMPQTALAEARAVPVKTLAMRFVRLRRKLRDLILRGLNRD